MILNVGAFIYKFIFSRALQRTKRMFEYGGGFIQDRSIYEDVDIFAKMHEEQGTMSPEDFNTYSELFNAMVMTPYFPNQMYLSI